MPALSGVLETALYVDDMERAQQFYGDVMGLAPMVRNERICAYPVAPASVLLIFRRGGSLDHETPHDGSGPVHVAFAIPAEHLDAWEAHLAAHGVAVENRTKWPLGGTSLYFRDPDGHLLELATPGVWQNY